jgi:prevent-host-death family protein
MTRVSISELKAQLSKYIREVKRGGEVQVLDRGEPVALLVAIPKAPQPQVDDERRERLIRAGVLRPGTGDARAILAKPPLKLSGADLLKALDEEREDRF